MRPFEHEHDIALGIKNSDQYALKIFYERHYLQLTRFLFSRTHSREQAEDLAQDAFFRLWENRSGINPDRSLKSYLFQIANNLFIDKVRRLRVERKYADSGSVPQSHEPSPETGISVRDAVERLPESLRAVFLLSRLEGFSYREIGQALDLSARTVEHRIYKALDILRKRLGEEK